MNILLHTIAFEPARWTLQRVSQKLTDLIPKIAGTTPFKELEIYEPHLTTGDEESIKELLAKHGLTPVILSSYLQVGPKMTDDEKFLADKADLVARVHRFQFQKVRLFPGGGVSPKDTAAVKIVADRIAQIGRELPGVQFLLETHDGSIADQPQAVVALVDQINLPNVGLLYQPTVFQPDQALKQLAVQRRVIRHVHLQNRNSEGKISTLKDGVVPWHKLLPLLNVDATLEFVPSGICPVEKFDLDRTLKEAVTEADYVRSIVKT